MSANQGGALAEPSSWRPRILVLDDEWASLERIKKFLTPDYEITTASRAKEALEAMDSSRFDVVLCDVRMPDIDGLSLVTRMKDRYPDTQYILNDRLQRHRGHHQRTPARGGGLSAQAVHGRRDAPCAYKLPWSTSA